MLSVKTTRFGDIDIDEQRLVYFPEGLLGFPEQKQYVILEHKPGSPFFWLQSLDIPDLAFVVINPYLVKKDFVESLSDQEKDFFEVTEGGERIVFALVTITPGKVENMTVNLLGPLVIDAGKRIGRQVILANSGYNRQHPLYKA